MNSDNAMNPRLPSRKDLPNVLEDIYFSFPLDQFVAIIANLPFMHEVWNSTSGGRYVVHEDTLFYSFNSSHNLIFCSASNALDQYQTQLDEFNETFYCNNPLECGVLLKKESLYKDRGLQRTYGDLGKYDLSIYLDGFHEKDLVNFIRHIMQLKVIYNGYVPSSKHGEWNVLQGTQSHYLTLVDRADPRRNIHLGTDSKWTRLLIPEEIDDLVKDGLSYAEFFDRTCEMPFCQLVGYCADAFLKTKETHLKEQSMQDSRQTAILDEAYDKEGIIKPEYVGLIQEDRPDKFSRFSVIMQNALTQTKLQQLLCKGKDPMTDGSVYKMAIDLMEHVRMDPDFNLRTKLDVMGYKVH